jgi:hypothetical protein
VQLGELHCAQFAICGSVLLVSCQDEQIQRLQMTLLYASTLGIQLAQNELRVGVPLICGPLQPLRSPLQILLNGFAIGVTHTQEEQGMRIVRIGPLVDL